MDKENYLRMYKWLNETDYEWLLEIIKDERHLKDILAWINKRINNKWYKAYHILMDYWDYIPDDLKEEVHDRLNNIGC